MKPSVTHASFAVAVLALPSAAQVQFQNGAWANTLGGAGNDWVQAMAAHSDGGVFVAGRTSSFGAGSEDVWVTRLNRRGLTMWETAVGTSGYEEALTMIETADGGGLVGGGAFLPGATSTDAWLVQLDWTGAIFWQKSYASPDEDQIRSIAPSPDGGFYLGGTILDPNGNYDVWVSKVDMWGNVLWQEKFDGGDADFLTSITATDDGVAFVANSNSGFASAAVPGVPFARPWLVSLDDNGKVLWQKTYNFSGGDAWNQIVALDDGGFIAAGEILFAAFFRGDVWVVRLDPDGNVMWDRRMGDSNGNLGFDGAVGVRQTSDGGFAVLAGTETAKGGLWMFKLDARGTHLWNRSYGGNLFMNATAFGLSPNQDLLLAGVYFNQGTGDSDSLVVRLRPNGHGPTGCELASPANPNLWSTVLEVDAVALDPTATALVVADTAAGTTSASTATYLCPPGGPTIHRPDQR